MPELFAEMSKSRETLNMKNWDSLTEKISTLQQEIAKKWLNRPEVLTSIEAQRENELLTYRAEEMEGRFSEDGKNKMSPDNFFATYRVQGDIPMMDKVKNEISLHGGSAKTYENATEALYELYNNTSNKGSGDVTAFKNSMYKLAGVSQNDIAAGSSAISAKLKNDVVRLHNLFEKSFSVNKVQLNLGPENKSTSFTAAVIS